MKHYIIVKWNELVENKLALIPNIQELFDKTKEIRGIYNVTLTPNCIDRSNRYDLMICIEMDKASLVDYDNSIYHHKWKEEYSKYILSKTIFDAE